MPWPTGWVPSESNGRTVTPKRLPTSTNRPASRSAASSERTFAVGPTGMSSTTWVAPAAIFLDITEAMSWPSLSMSSARSTRISTSSAGARCTAPPQARQAPARATTACICGSVSATVVSVSSVSAVPEGEVMARDEVLGSVRPQAAPIATTMGVVRLPGRPPTECLSATMALSQ